MFVPLWGRQLAAGGSSGDVLRRPRAFTGSRRQVQLSRSLPDLVRLYRIDGWYAHARVERRDVDPAFLFSAHADPAELVVASVLELWQDLNRVAALEHAQSSITSAVALHASTVVVMNLLSLVPLWRHNGAMKDVSKDPCSIPLERINLRLDPEMLVAIDAERSRRAGNVSRNTWITEAVAERLERLARLSSSSRSQGSRASND